jgi:hypothetical protein
MRVPSRVPLANPVLILAGTAVARPNRASSALATMSGPVKAVPAIITRVHFASPAMGSSIRAPSRERP